MSKGGFSHFAVRKRSIRIGLFNVAVWILGVIIGFIGLIVTSQLWPLLFIPLGLLIGLPIPDIGSPHAWVIREWGARSQWKHDQGVMLHAPLTSKPGDKRCKIERVELVMARIAGKKGGKDTFLPLFTTADRGYVTLPLKVGGASDLWLNSDGDGKYNWDLDWLDGVARALSTTREPTLDFIQSRTHRPANKETGLAYNRSRGEVRVLAAAASDGDPQYNDVEVGIGKNLIQGFENAYAAAGEPSNYCCVRIAWPKRFGRKISLDDADAFRRSNLFKTISKILDAYTGVALEVELVDLGTIRAMWDEFWNVSDLDTLRMYRERDQELATATKTGQVEEPQLKKPVSIRASKPGGDRWIAYGGSYHVAGYATKINRDNLRAGFQEGAVVLSDDTYYTLTTYIEAPLVTSEVTKSREKERLLKTLQGWNPLTKGLSNPEEAMRFEEVLERRVRLAEGSQRAGNFFNLASTVAKSPEEAEARWDDMCAQLVGTYTFERATDRDDIEDILLAQLGIKID